jgi:hypothetical protein
MMNISPVLVFGFNRPHSLAQILHKIPMESGRIVWISIDGPRKEMDQDNTHEVRCVAESFQERWGNQVKLIKREQNLGLQKNCIASMREFFESHNTGIIFDDDIVPTAAFFEYMDFMLERYQDDKRIFAVNGWTPFLPKDKINRAHLTRYFVSWGWGTWSDRFLKVDFDLNDYNRGNWWKIGTTANLEKNLGFRIFWTRRFNTVTSGPENRSWDWEFLHEMWKMNGVCVSPRERLVTNVGYDQFASHPNSGNFRQKAAATEQNTKEFLEVEENYDMKIDLKYERLMWDLGRQRILSSGRYRLGVIKSRISKMLIR